MPILRLERVSKSFGRRHILYDLDLELPGGSFNLLVGPNASGKTTLLRMLGTVVRPSQGTIRWTSADGKEALTPERVRARTGYAGHTPLVYNELTARENLEFGLRMRGRDPADARDRTFEALQTFGLLPRAEERVASWSRGLRQRLALALAFAPRPELLLLDEPSSNLDSRGQEALATSLQAAKGRATVVLATHDPDPFRRLATRTLELFQGRLRDWSPRA